NLGNIRTASRKVFFGLPERAGIGSGFNAYDAYVKTNSDIRYFNTQSPYTAVTGAFGSNTRSILDVDFARNVTPLWNISSQLIISDIDKYTARARKNDRQTKTYDFTINTWYKSQSGRYELTAAINRFGHQEAQQGGVLVNSSDPFKYNESEVLLNDASSEELRLQFHALQQYILNEQFQAYWQTDYRIQHAEYSSIENELSKAVLPTNQDTTKSFVAYNEWINEAGLKGYWRKWFYQVYAKRKDYSYEQEYFIKKGRNYFDPSGKEIKDTVRVMQTGRTSGAEHGLGGFMRLDFDSLNYVSASGEFLQTGDHKLEGRLVLPWFEGSYTRMQSAVPLFYRRFEGLEYNFNTDFRSQQTDRIRGKLKWNWRGLQLEPALTLTNYVDYIYLQNVSDQYLKVQGKDELREISLEPRQAAGTAQVWSPEFNLKWQFWKRFHLEGQVIYTLRTGDEKDVFEIPQWYGKAKFYFESGLILQKKINLQLGTDLYFLSAYRGFDYDPITQHFFRQSDGQRAFEVAGKPVADVFMNLRFGTFYLFVKYTNGFQSEDSPSYITPYYIIAQPGLDFGIKWRFFD
ncbi:MAG: putative porin, partial [Cytophagales bacterium]|nr:putative porin [Cytophagales bacterium]